MPEVQLRPVPWKAALPNTARLRGFTSEGVWCPSCCLPYGFHAKYLESSEIVSKGTPVSAEENPSC